MKKKEIDDIVNTVIKNHSPTFPNQRSVSKRKIRGLVKQLISKGIQVKTVSVPYGKEIVEDPNPRWVDVHILTYKVGPKYPIEIDDDATVVFLYQWYKQKLMGRDSILRLKSITRRNI